MLIERRDDYQLLQFVAEYKGLQLFAGIFTAVSGAGDYLSRLAIFHLNK